MSPIFFGVVGVGRMCFGVKKLVSQSACVLTYRSLFCKANSSQRRLWSSLAGSQLGLNGENSKCPIGEVSNSCQVPGATFIKPILQRYLRPNGILQGRYLIEFIADVATVAADRYCNQQATNGKRETTLCSLTSVDELEFLEPIQLTDIVVFDASVISTTDHSLVVQVLAGKKYFPDKLKPTNLARLSFEATSLDRHHRHFVVPLKQPHLNPNDDHHQRPLPVREKGLFKDVTDVQDLLHLQGSSFRFLQPVDTKHPMYCNPEVLAMLMEEYGTIFASRLTCHEVVTVHMSVTFKELLRPGLVTVVSGELASTSGDIVTIFLTVDAIAPFKSKVKKCRAAEGFISYVSINSRNEMVPISELQISSKNKTMSNKGLKDIVIKQDIVSNYVNSIKIPHKFFISDQLTFKSVI